MASNTTASGTKKPKKFFGAFRKNRNKKAKKPSAAATIAMENKSPEHKKQFLVQDSNSSTTEDVNLLELDSDVEYSLDLVVLLMHPVSHRFELLQLEFDEASKAKISDLLAQIPLSVTENCLKDQLYDGILNQDSADPSSPLLLKSTKLIDAFGRKLSKPDDSAKPAIKMVLVARPQGLSNEEALKMAKPIFTNKDISSMLALSGFDVKAWKKKKFSSRSSVSATAPEDEKKVDEPVPVEEAPAPSSATSLSLLGLVFAFIVSMLLHSVMIRPTPINAVLKPGSYSSKCGLAGFVPFKSEIQKAAKDYLEMDLFSCEDEYFKVNSDGTATLYDSGNETIMTINGAVCSDDDDSCVNGLMMKSDKTLEMGGKPVKQILVKNTHKNKQLSWPFEEDPAKLRYKVVYSLN